MPVRDARPGDVAEIAAMVREHAAHEGALEQCRFDAGAGRAALFGPSPTLRALVAHLEGEAERPAGFALWYPTFSSWAATAGIWLEDLYVRPEHRRSGLGRELLAALRAATPGRIEWDVKHGNDDAAAFYRRLGAAPVEGWTKYRWV